MFKSLKGSYVLTFSSCPCVPALCWLVECCDGSHRALHQFWDSQNAKGTEHGVRPVIFLSNFALLDVWLTTLVAKIWNCHFCCYSNSIPCIHWLPCTQRTDPSTHLLCQHFLKLFKRTIALFRTWIELAGYRAHDQVITCSRCTIH